MTLDPAIRQQTYQYFLQEAPELLQTIEHGLLQFRDDHGINQVNNLMRATHTLKGAATSVGLETIATVAHSLEDIFKALCQPNLTIDPEVEALLFEGFECLRAPLVAELTGGTANHAEVLDRAAAVFAQLQETLGDCFDQTASLPTSAELGFDIAQSIFEVGVAQRLEQIEAVLAEGQPDEVATVLQTQAEVFLGLAESLNLLGFRAIAQTAIAALNHRPDEAIAIAEVALADFRAGQAAVLAGDRLLGGQPSEALQQLAGGEPSASDPLEQADLSEPDVASDDFQEDSIANSLLENIWGGQAPSTDPDPDSAPTAITVAAESLKPTYRLADAPQSTNSPASTHSREPVSLAPHIRVNVKHLDHLNYSVGELLTTQNRQSLQIEHLQSAVRALLIRIAQHQQLLNQLRNGSNQPTHSTELPQQRVRKQTGASKKTSRNAKRARGTAKLARQASLESSSTDQSHLIQTLLDDMVQLTEASDAIDLFTRQSHQMLEHQRQLLTNTRNALIEARMLPLGEIFNRLPPVLQQLETLYNKQVSLNLRGTDVLVDKVVAEKLYDPLLHLVRNAFDHGIEAVPVRQQYGKSTRGTIEITAHNRGRYLVIEVRDDGRGLSFDHIRQRAIERHLITLEQALHIPDDQLIDLLFEPGFSTAAQVNDISGRGIGLDVVRNQLQALHGSVTVYSQPNEGTTFVLQIPLSLTIAQLLVCEAGKKLYALLDDAVEQVVIPQASHLQTRNHCKVLRWRKGDDETLVPIYELATVVKNGSSVPIARPAQSQAPRSNSQAPVVLLRHRNSLLGLEVDQLIGEQELLIRPLGTLIAAPSYVHGASISADGRLALVVDGSTLVETLFAWAQERAPDYARRSSPWIMAPSLQSYGPQTQIALPARTAEVPGTRILVVDDSITTRQAIVFTLQKAGYQVLQAQNGQEAIAYLQQDPDIQLVTCDIEMPGMNGFEFLRHAQQNTALSNLPIVMLSSRSDEKYRSLAMQLGASTYMTKPFMEHKLLTEIASLLERIPVSAMLE